MTERPLRLIAGGATRPPTAAGSELAYVVQAAVDGDERALGSLVSRFDRTLRRTARSYGLDRCDVDDVVQHTWMQFLAHGSGLRNPGAISGWLITTARRESLRMLQCHVRERLTDEPGNELVAEGGDLDAEIIAGEARAALYASLGRLSERQRELMTLLLEEPHLSYEEVARRLGLPIGSIGPTRMRSLALLRRESRLQAVR